MNGSAPAVHGTSAPEKISVYILAANRLLRETLERILRRAGFDVAGSTEEPRAGLEEAAKIKPCVLLINGGASQADCATLILEARRAAPNAPVVLFGAREEPETLFH